MSDTEKLFWTDAADSPGASYTVDMTELDNLDDHRLDAIHGAIKDHADKPVPVLARAILNRIKPIETAWHDRESRTDRAVYLSGLLVRIIESPNPRLEAVSLAMASGLPQYQHLSLTVSAEACGVSKQAMSKRILKIREAKSLPNLPGRKSDQARKNYQKTQTERSKKCLLPNLYKN